MFWRIALGLQVALVAPAGGRTSPGRRYPGYSISDAGTPTEELCYEAVEAGYAYLRQTLGLPAASVRRGGGAASVVGIAWFAREISF